MYKAGRNAFQKNAAYIGLCPCLIGFTQVSAAKKHIKVGSSNCMRKSSCPARRQLCRKNRK